MTRKLKAKKLMRPWNIIQDAVEGGVAYGIGARLFKYRSYPPTYEQWREIEDAVINELTDYVMKRLDTVMDFDR